MQGKNYCLRHYGTAVLAVVLALTLKLALYQLIEEESLFFLFFAAVIVTAWYGGWKPGLFATTLSALAGNYFALTPLYTFQIDSAGQILRLALFTVEGILISFVIAQLQTARRKAEINKLEAQQNLNRQQETYRELQAVWKKLQESEARFRSVVDSNTIGIIFDELNGNITDANDALLKIIGYTREELLAGKISWRKLTPLEYLPLDEKALAHVTKSGICTPYEKEYIRKDGSRVPILIGFSLYPSQSHGVGFVLDLTKLKQQQDTLRKSEEKFRTLIANIPGAVYRCFDILDGRGMFISDAITEISGYLASDFAERGTRTFNNIIHPEDWQKVQDVVNEAIAQKQHFVVEYRILHADGSIRWVYDKGQGIFNSAGELAWIDGVIFDITLRKQTEAALQESETLYRTLANALPHRVWSCLPDGRLDYANQQWHQQTGLTVEQINQRGWSVVFHPEDIPEVLKSWRICNQTGVGAEIEVRSRCADGKYNWYLTRIEPLKNAQGQIIKWIGTCTNIEHLKNIQNALQESEERLRLAVEVAQMGTWYRDLPKREDTWSEQCKTILGLPKNAHPSYELFISRIHPEDSDWVEQEILYAITTHQEFNIECRIVWPDSTIHWINNRGRAFYDHNGSPVRLLGMCVDISDRKYAQEALQESEERLRLALEASQMGFWDLNLLTRTALCSEQHAKMFGLPPGSYHRNSQEFLNSVHPDDRAYVTQAIKSAIQEGRDYNPEFRAVWPDGTVRWVISKGKVYRDRNELPVRMVGVAIDITERKLVEEEIYRSRRKFQTLAENSPDIIFRYDKNCRYLYMNPAVERSIGISRLNFVGKKPIEVGVPSEIAAAWQNNLQQVFTTGQEFVIDENLSTINGMRWFQTLLVPEFAQDGSVESVMGIVRDITNLKQAEAALQQQAEQLAQANRLKDEFLAIVSHELRSPLSAILTAIKVIRYKKVDQTGISRELELIERNGNLQFSLIEDLLDVSRIIQGKLRINTRLLDVIPIIEAAIEVVHPAAQAKAIQLEPVFENSVCQVIGDAERLQQVIWNLLGNAVKFTPKEGRVKISLQRIDSNVEIKVSDTGKGINPEFVPFVFDRFSQATNSPSKRENVGLGLGLAIVRHLVELHGGKVSASSEGEGKGATFTVELPVAAIALKANYEKSPKIIPTVASPTSLPSSKILNDLKLLVVDNSVDTCKVIAAVLELFGAKVTVANSVNEALALLEKSKPDVLLSDIGMPGESGYDLISKVKAMEAEKGVKIPAIALTALCTKDDRNRAISAGFEMFLSKPAEPKELANAIATIARRTSS